MKNLLTITFILSLIPVFAEDAKPTPIFAPPKSMLDTAERVLTAEKEPTKRIEILFRWIQIKESYEQGQRLLAKQAAEKTAAETGKALEVKDESKDIGGFVDSKKEIVEKLIAEVKNLEGTSINLDRLHRELGFRLTEMKRMPEAIVHFELLSKRTLDDELAYGDCLLADHRNHQALDAYDKASHDPRYVPIAAYKKAWAYMTLNDFQSSLIEFDIALQDNPHATARMREEAYKDRLRPYIETYSKPDFDPTEAQALRALALRVKPTQTSNNAPSTGLNLYQEALKSLVEGFNAKQDIKKAQHAYKFLMQEIPKDGDQALQILAAATPVWLKIHRGRLEHNDVKDIVLGLPDKEMPVAISAQLQAELNNTAAFYETLLEDQTELKGKVLEPQLKEILMISYKKYFVLFPKDPEADPLRINYAKHSLSDGDAETCLATLSGRSKKDEKVERVAFGLEAQCNLKLIDQLYARPHDDNFYTRLNAALMVDKLYKRPEIGVPEESAFQSLIGMLVGSLKKNSKSEILRGTLTKVIAEWPYSPEQPRFKELKILAAELRFEDLVASKDPEEKKSDAFYVIYQEVPKTAPVALKALRNSIMFSWAVNTLSRCDEVASWFSDQFDLKQELFGHCVSVAERNIDLNKEIAYWRLHEKKLDAKQQIRLGLLEMGNNYVTAGRNRITKVKGPSSQATLEFWDGYMEAKAPLNPAVKELEKATRQFVGNLRKVAFAKISKVVPVVIGEYKQLDKDWIRYSKADKDKPLALAKVLSSRALMAVRMRDWMNSLPEPTGITPEELEVYRKKAKEVVQPWQDLADQSIKECSESAYALTPEFEEAPNCPESTKPATWNQLMTSWDKSRQDAGAAGTPWDSDKATENQKVYRALFEASKSEKDPMKARYLLVRAFDLGSDKREKAQVLLGLAKLTDKERFWRGASETDGNLMEPIQWLKTRANGNPFYDRLYDEQIKLIQKNERFTPVKVTSDASGGSRGF